MNDLPDPPEGRRSQKKRETHLRVAEAGLRLFVDQGYDETTLDAIASEAGISRRTIFYYFKSKEDIVHFWRNNGFLEALHPVMMAQDRGLSPIRATENCLMQLAERYETKESIVVDRLVQSTEVLRTRKDTVFIDMEDGLYKALIDLWPQRDQQEILRLTAMIAIGTLRLSIERWRQDNAQQQLALYVARGFETLAHVRNC